MLELSLTFLTSLTTIIAVVMATIFFCCWGKRGSVDVEDKPAKEAAAVSQGESPAVSAAPDKAGENGATHANSPVNIVVDSSELGDFSAVSRETDILRSYRKPPPPKNRARQSRAPRALLKSSTENLDIFTELSEDSRSLSLGLPLTDTSLEDRPSRPDSAAPSEGSPTLRPRPLADDSPDGGGPRREDVRSSMLADIEQTLAALHLRAEQGDKDGHTDGEKNALSAHTKAASVSSLTSAGAERDAQSPPRGPSPLLTHKVGPPVSPKPAARKTILTNLRSSDEVKADGKEINVLLKAEATVCALQNNSSLEATTADTLGSDSNGPESTDNEVSADVVTSAENPENSESKQGNLPNETDNLSSPSEENPSSSVTESKLSDPAAHSPTEDNDTPPAESATLPESDSKLARSDSENGDAPKRPPSMYDNLEDNEDANTATGDEAQAPDTEKTPGDHAGSSAADVPELPSEAGDKAPSPADGETSSDQGDLDGSDQAAASREEQAGKGKTSRIPVRAGSKPRSTPPKQEEGSN
ncbi:hypothetical protein EGW08_001530 [Elysia chlorotica]|uniref:Uncharacterized protein n=1 Tax=Elysia chlorotica TaxID=188477 RepID=A0A3S1CET3_ELYCH|nr:hypothetical protein EGW08_001530 [Elysia chlorotica]